MRWLLLVLAPCLAERLSSHSLLQSHSELHEVHPKASEWLERCVGCGALVLTLCLAAYLKHVVEDYEETSPPDAAPWYCEERIIQKAEVGDEAKGALSRCLSYIYIYIICYNLICYKYLIYYKYI